MNSSTLLPSTPAGVLDDFQMSCRFSNYGNFAPEEFDSVSCGACFYFIYMILEHYKSYTTHLCPDVSGLLVCPGDMPKEYCNCQNRSLVYNIPEFALNASNITPFSKLELDPPLPFQFELIVKDCCSAARYCCRNTLIKYNHFQDNAPCPATWDGWNCFDSTTVGDVPKQCPNYIYGGATYKIDYDPIASKKCTNVGWELKKLDGNIREHTDYSGCHSNSDAESRITVGLLTYLGSVIFLVPAVLLLSWLRPIRYQPMFLLHRHLLLSCLAYGGLYVVTVTFYIRDGAPLSYQISQNHLVCRFLFTIQLRYLRMTNFTWMLAEGVYLYRLLYTATHATEGENMSGYKFFGWGVPAIITTAYMVVRWMYDDVGMCWIENSTSAWIESMIIAPSVLAMGGNFLLLCLILFILCKKLRDDPNYEKAQYRKLSKAVRGAFMLVPVFGLQQLLTIYRFSNMYYQIFDQALNGIQGALASAIVCYTNKSVIEALTKMWSSRQEKRAIGAECRQRRSIQENGKLILRSPPINTEHVAL